MFKVREGWHPGEPPCVGAQMVCYWDSGEVWLYWGVENEDGFYVEIGEPGEHDIDWPLDGRFIKMKEAAQILADLGFVFE